LDKVVKIKNIVVGQGAPKICASMIGETRSQILEEADFLKSFDLDFVEWRVDFYKDVENIDIVKQTLLQLRAILPQKPMIFTFRSKREGGGIEVSIDYYFKLNKAVAETKLIDVIDIELFNDENNIKQIVDIAHFNDVRIIISSHDFKGTPSKEEIIERLRKSFKLGGDISKIAVMPNCAEDVITLLDATRIMKEKYAEGPIISIAMGGKGIVSRICGELFGSSLTFAAGIKASAPGQISLEDLKRTLQLIHNNL
jgi:3-dehydroquinate dehydratase-1